MKEIKFNSNSPIYLQISKYFESRDEIGLIITEKSKGSVITSDLEILHQLRDDYIKEPLIEFISSMKSIKIDKEKVIDLLDKYYDETKEDLLDDTSTEFDKEI